MIIEYVIVRNSTSFLINITLFSRKTKKEVISAENITKMVLTLPDGPSECNDTTKLDFETLMIDPIMGDIYMIQKNIFSTDVNIYKVSQRISAFYGLKFKT